MKKNRLFDDSEIILNDLLRGRYQKERTIDKCEMNSKTLKPLKNTMLRILDINSEIAWLDVGCGDGRCLSVLEIFSDNKMRADKKNKIRYLGIDISDQHEDDIEKLIKKYKINGEFKVDNARNLKFKSRFDIISFILAIHEVDPIDLPHIIKNLIRLLKNDGKLIISDFNDPFEKENKIIIWKGVEIFNMINYSGGLVTSMELEKSSEIPSVSFYNISAKRFNYERNQFKQLIDNYDKILELKLRDLIAEYRSIEEFLISRIYEIAKKEIRDIRSLNQKEKIEIGSQFSENDLILYERKELIKDQIVILNEKIFEIRKVA